MHVQDHVAIHTIFFRMLPRGVENSTEVSMKMRSRVSLTDAEDGGGGCYLSFVQHLIALVRPQSVLLEGIRNRQSGGM